MKRRRRVRPKPPQQDPVFKEKPDRLLVVVRQTALRKFNAFAELELGEPAGSMVLQWSSNGSLPARTGCTSIIVTAENREKIRTFASSTTGVRAFVYDEETEPAFLTEKMAELGYKPAAEPWQLGVPT